jgi:predicted metal-dependent TIM-barrel fold hydrolase
MLGMTLQPGKSTGQEVLSVLRDEPRVVDALILNSDGAKEMSRPYVQAVQEGLHVDRDTENKIFLDNARKFWGLW